jgi:uncharacterized protein (TIGR02996 family)
VKVSLPPQTGVLVVQRSHHEVRPMDQNAAFVQAILENPDDDGVRLVYADWLEEHDDPRGEFIRLQIQLAREARNLPSSSLVRERLEQREQDLLEKLEREWVPRIEMPAGEARISLVRGMPEQLELYIDGESFHEPGTLALLGFLSRVGEWSTRWGIRRLVAWQGGITRLPGFVDWPPLRRIDSLHFDIDGHGSTTVGPAGVRVLVGSPELTHLKRLELRGQELGDEGARVIADSRFLQHLHTLDLNGNEITTDGALAILESPNLPSLVDIDLGSNQIEDRVWGIFLHSPRWADLKRLVVTDYDLSDESFERLSGYFGDRLDFG